MSGYRTDGEWARTDWYGDPMPSGWRVWKPFAIVLGAAFLFALFGKLAWFFLLLVPVYVVSAVLGIRTCIRRGYANAGRPWWLRIYRNESPIGFWIQVAIQIVAIPILTGIFLLFAAIAS